MFNFDKDGFNKSEFGDFFKKKKTKTVNFNNGANNFKENKDKFMDFINKKDNERKGLNIGIIALLTLLIMAIIFFFTLPALNFMDSGFYMFLITALVVFNVLNLVLGSFSLKKTILPSILIGVILFITPIVLSFLSSPFFRAKSYANIINPVSAEFKSTVQKLSIDKIPVVDREAASMIGDKEMGTIPELVSQFDIDDNYTQLNVAGHPMRVSPLKYNDFFKYLNNMNKGLEYYVSVNMSNQQGNLVKLSEPIKYSKSDILFRNINRKVRFQYPFLLLGESNFEVDDSGRAYYVTPVLTKRIGFMNGLDANGVIVTDAANGTSTRYALNEIPTWVDRAFPSEIIINQLDNRGKFQGGFFNSLFGQKGVTRTTDGYNYIPMDNDIYLFTGVTSVMKDSSNIGFYFVNLRTKEAKFFSVPSADEKSAMRSAEGAVKEKGYGATFPILLNINDKPVYLMSLKDNTKTAKMFALVDAEQFTNVAVGSTVSEVLNKFNVSFNASDKPSESSTEVAIVVEKINQVVIDGNTIYFIKAKDNDKVFVATAKQLGAKGAFIGEGDSLKVFGNDKGEQFDIIELR